MRRRTFLGGLGAALLGGSTGLGGRVVWAQARPTARRLLVVFTPDGVVHRFWRPTVSQEGLRFEPGSVLEPLAHHAPKLTVVDGLEYVGVANHDRGMLHMLTGGTDATSHTGGASLDQVVARAIGDATRFRSLELGVQTSVDEVTMQSRMSFRRAFEPVPPNDDPRDVYARLFRAEDPEAVRRLARRRSVLDVTRAELAELRARVGGAERAKLDAHLEALREVERGLEPAVDPTCAAPEVPEFDPDANHRFPDVGRMQTDLAVTALACDMTRVASLQWSKANSQTVFSWLGHAEAHHTLSHSEDSSPEDVARYIEAERWYGAQMAYLLDRLDALPEPDGDGTLLDHTVVLWMTEIGDSRRHQCVDMPAVIAGGGAAGLRTGRYIRANGASHCKLHTELCWALGLELPSFGDGNRGEGGLEGLRA